MTKPTHDSQRGWFAAALFDAMSANENIWFVTGDLGFGMADAIRAAFPHRFINVGAAEQAMVGIGVGLALDGKIPFCYSITPFVLYRPFEWIRNYLSHEKIAVKLVGAGLDDDYKKDGFTHHAFDAKAVLATLPNIETFWPERKEDVPGMVATMAANRLPSFIALRK